MFWQGARCYKGYGFITFAQEEPCRRLINTAAVNWMDFTFTFSPTQRDQQQMQQQRHQHFQPYAPNVTSGFPGSMQHTLSLNSRTPGQSGGGYNNFHQPQQNSFQHQQQSRSFNNGMGNSDGE